MTNMELLCHLGAVRDSYIEEANQVRSRRKRLRLSRTALIAAVLAVLLLLAGCVAVFMSLEDRKIGEFTRTYQFDEYGNAIEPTEKVLDVMTMSGKLGSPNQLATQQWYEFTQSYDPSRVFSANDDQLEHIPDNFEYNYGCYTQEMVDKLTEIAQTHGVKLLETRKVTQREQYQESLDCLGIEGLLLPGARAEYRYGVCWLFPPCTFDFDISLTLEDPSVWEGEVWAEYFYLDQAYLYPNNLFTYDLAACQQWEYVTADGTKVLLVMDSRQGTILAERDGVDIVVLLDFINSVFLDENTVLPTREALEAFADLFDYHIQPRQIDVNLISPEEVSAYEPEVFAGYADYINGYYARPQYYQYAFHDVDGNGAEDLLVGYRDDGNFFTDCWTLVDGMAQRLIWGPARVCQDGVLENNSSDAIYDTFRVYYRVKKVPSPNESNVEVIAAISCQEGIWYQDGEVISKEQAEAVIAQYPPLDLEWHPLETFLMDENGTTFGDIIDAEGKLSEKEIEEFYARQDYSESYYEPLQYFCLRDINGDNITDLLLSVDGEMVNASYTVLRGELRYLETDFYLCEGGWESVSYSEDLRVGKVKSHFFYYQENGKTKVRDDLIHFLSTDTWQDERGNPVTNEEAEAIFAKYPRLTLPFRPLEELGR